MPCSPTSRGNGPRLLRRWSNSGYQPTCCRRSTATHCAGRANSSKPQAENDLEAKVLVFSSRRHEGHEGHEARNSWPRKLRGLRGLRAFVMKRPLNFGGTVLLKTIRDGRSILIV